MPMVRLQDANGWQDGKGWNDCRMPMVGRMGRVGMIAGCQGL